MKSKITVTSERQHNMINEIIAIKVAYTMELVDVKDSTLTKYDVIQFAAETEKAMLLDGEVSSHLCDFDANVIERAITTALHRNDNGIRDDRGMHVRVPSVNEMLTQLTSSQSFQSLVGEYNRIDWAKEAING